MTVVSLSSGDRRVFEIRPHRLSRGLGGRGDRKSFGVMTARVWLQAEENDGRAKTSEGGCI